MTEMNNKFLMLFVLAGMLFSCDDDITDKSFITNVTPFNITGPTTVITDESAEVVTITFELDENQILDTEVRVIFDADNSTATMDEDIHFSEELVFIPAFQRSGSFEVEILNDFTPEDVETARFLILPVGPETGFLWSIEDAFPIDLKITNVEGCDLEVILGWDAIYDVVVEVTGTAAYGGPFDLITDEDIVDGPQQLNGCAFADFDFLTVDNEFAFFYGGFSPQTANCPESIVYPADGVITNGTADADTFFIFSNLYINWGDSEFTSDPEPLPVIAQFTKQGVLADTWTQSPAFAYQTNTPGDFGSFANIRPILEIRKDGCTWSIFEDATQVFTARQREALREINNGTRELKWYENR